MALINRGVRVLTANGDDLTDSSDPSRVMMRQIAGAFHQYEKARLVAKLKAARQRKRELVGKVKGRKAWAEINPELVKEARRLRRRSRKEAWAWRRSRRRCGRNRAPRPYSKDRLEKDFAKVRKLTFGASELRQLGHMRRSGGSRGGRWRCQRDRSVKQDGQYCRRQ